MQNGENITGKSATRNESAAFNENATRNDGAAQNKNKAGAAAGESRICVISILVSDLKSAEQINAALSAYGEYIIGRMGVPYKAKNVSVLSVALDAPVEVTNALTGKIGKLNGVYVKALFGKI
ncbi:MAG: TM1266 family iron-only hydrogenase system putative regulator [Candidatus Scatosoma sp.]